MSQFRISSSDNEFNNRVAGLFSCLDDVTTTLSTDDGLVFEPSTSGVKENSNKRNTEETGSDMECDTAVGNFKIPLSNIPIQKRFKSQRRPDYVINPKKWTRYAMKDTPVLSEAQNKAVGLQLLADLKNKIEAEIPDRDINDSEEKIIFKKQLNQTTNEAENETMEYSDQPEKSENKTNDFGGTQKFVMDEYVVGAKKKKSKKSKAQNTGDGSLRPTNEIKLSYLSFADEEIE